MDEKTGKGWRDKALWKEEAEQKARLMLVMTQATQAAPLSKG